MGKETDNPFGRCGLVVCLAGDEHLGGTSRFVPGLPVAPFYTRKSPNVRVRTGHGITAQHGGPPRKLRKKPTPAVMSFRRSSP
jgi:hypothetical protein